ncbi:efflux RND transporter periplasmic adaptor subunit [Prosthecomicrobium pneumaticum]|uniref:HlyD family secretion protein n=1 Tax=Prosthecomicrobium pneumaticum TaxID=81895 RepID=A0A7W9CTG5_9HYPH|nr:efflux RND transporter periplasmic adaptor subunit [Prosthecomicrobium pneumaticum]MBB5751097.1 HlyD family secretion protein [Prosthecomicrobium pneumaticum]
MQEPSKTAAKEASVDQQRLRDLLASSGPSRAARLMRWIGLAAVLVAAVLGYLYWSGSSTQTSYTTAAATRGDLVVTVSATGSLQPTDEVTVSSEQSGTIRLVNVDYNSRVKKGDVLAEIDKTSLTLAVDSARAALRAAEASVAQAKATVDQKEAVFNRTSALATRNFSSQQDLESAKADYELATAAVASAEADVDKAKAALSTAETNLARADIVSPIDGVVLSRDVDPGQTVAASFQAPELFTIAGDLTRMELQADVDEADVGSVKAGQAATFTVDAYADRVFPSSVRDIRFMSETTDNVVTYKALLEVDNSELILRPGMTATADIVAEKVENALLIANAALRYAPPQTASRSSGGGLFGGLFRPPQMGAATTNVATTGKSRTVWVLKEGVPTAVPIEIGSTDGQRTVVVSGGLAEGDLVITDAVTRTK